MADDLVHDPWYQYRNVIGVPSKKHIICGLVWIFLILMLVVVAFTVMSKKCCTETLQQSSIHIQSSLNLSIDPCENFYNFSCGLWAQNIPKQTNKMRITSFNILQDVIDEIKKNIFRHSVISEELPRVVNEALRFYNTCASVNNSVIDVSILVEYFNKIGGWPLLKGNAWDENSFDWFQASAFLVEKLDVHTIIGVNTIDDDKNDGRNVIFLKPPAVFQSSETLSNPASLGMLYSILNALNSSHSQKDLIERIDKLSKTELRWFKELWYSPISNPLPMTVEELTHRIPDFDWLNYLQLVVNDTLYEMHETVTLKDRVIVDNLDYFEKLAAVLKSNSFTKLELANLFGWFVVKDIWILIPGVLQHYAKLYGFNSDDIKNTADNQCYDSVLDIFPCGIDYLYVKNSSHLGIKDSEILINYLKSSFKEIVLNSAWLDSVSKNYVMHRLNHMQSVIGFQSYLNNKIEFDEMYEDFPTGSTNILKWYFLIQQYYFKLMILSLKLPFDSYNWVLPRSVSDVSAYYVVHRNALVFPISLHNPPFYYVYGPWYLNFGAIGSVIGHEVMHGFDNSEHQKSGFSNASSISYAEHAECFKDQYGVYDASGMYKNNGSRTLRENIADSEGLHVAFKAYKKYEMDYGIEETYKSLDNYTSEQMFFIAYGSVWCSVIQPEMRAVLAEDTHSFPEIRVNKAVSNSESFALAFGCPKGSPMNPVKKCSIW